MEGAKKKGLVFPAVIATAASDKTLIAETPENPRVRELGETGISFLSYASTHSGDGKSDIRKALASYLKIPEEERQKHIVFDDGSSNIKQAKIEGYRAYLIGGENGVSLDQALNEILQEKLYTDAKNQNEEKVTGVDIASGSVLNSKKHFYENRYRIAKVGSSVLVGGCLGYFAGAAYANATIATGTTIVCGISATLFVGMCTIGGAGLLLLIAYLINRYRTGRPGFFPSMPEEDISNGNGVKKR